MDYFITKRALAEIKKELAHLKDEKVWEIAKWLRDAADQGDMIENAEYLQAKEAQTALENRIKELEDKIRNAKVVKRRKKDVVDIGTTVEFSTTGSNKTKVVLVSSEEADVEKGKISGDSPMGKAMMGKKSGDNFEVITPKGKKKYKITRLV